MAHFQAQSPWSQGFSPPVWGTVQSAAASLACPRPKSWPVAPGLTPGPAAPCASGLGRGRALHRCPRAGAARCRCPYGSCHVGSLTASKVAVTSVLRLENRGLGVTGSAPGPRSRRVPAGALSPSTWEQCTRSPSSQVWPRLCVRPCVRETGCACRSACFSLGAASGWPAFLRPFCLYSSFACIWTPCEALGMRLCVKP